jgi:hypothetical protein
MDEDEVYNQFLKEFHFIILFRQLIILIHILIQVIEMKMIMMMMVVMGEIKVFFLFNKRKSPVLYSFHIIVEFLDRVFSLFYHYLCSYQSLINILKTVSLMTRLLVGIMNIDL